MNNTPLLERTLKAMTESRDDVADSISEIPPWKADYERRVALATAQLAEHDACLKALEAAIAEQAKPDPKCDEMCMYACSKGGAVSFECLEQATSDIENGCCVMCGALYDYQIIKQAKPQEPVAIVSEVHLSRFTIEWVNGVLPEGTRLYTRPQALEPMNEDEIKAILISIDPMTVRVPKGILSLVRAVEAHHIGVKK